MEYNYKELTDKQLIDRHKKLLKENLHLDVRPKKYIDEMTAIEKDFKERSIPRTKWY